MFRKIRVKILFTKLLTRIVTVEYFIIWNELRGFSETMKLSSLLSTQLSIIGQIGVLWGWGRNN